MKLVDGEREIELGEVKVANVQPGDIVVVTLSHVPDMEEMVMYRRYLHQVFGEVKVAVLSGGEKLEVIREAIS
ncbi:MAG: hypothetical protein SAMD01599839_08090 [Rectinema sp.]